MLNGGSHGGKFRVGIKAKVQHGLLFQARMKFATNKAMADHFNLSEQRMGLLLNLMIIPSERWMLRNKDFLDKLALLVGRSVTWDEVFPGALRSFDILDLPKEHVFFQDVDIEQLALSGAVPRNLLSDPLEDAINTKLREDVEAALQKLKPRERNIIERLYGLNGYESQTLREVGVYHGISPERVRQIQHGVFRKLRHPKRNKKLITYDPTTRT